MSRLSDFLTRRFLRNVLDQLSTLNNTLLAILKEMEKMTTIAEQIKEEQDELVVNVAENTTVTGSVVVAFNGLTTKMDELLVALKAAQDANDPTAQQAAYESLVAQNEGLKANTKVLAEAIPAGTPAEQDE